MNTEQKFQKNKEYRLYCLVRMGEKYKWDLVKNGYSLKFHNKEGTLLKITYHPEIVVETSLFHPIHGYNTLLRKGNFTKKIIESIFRNPRAHMDPKIVSSYKK